MMMNVVFCALPRNRAKQPETGIMKRCPPMLRQFCWNKSAFAGENRIGIPPRTGVGSTRVAPKKRKPAALLLQNEASAGHLEMRQLGEETHPEQPNLKLIVGEHRGRDVAD